MFPPAQVFPGLISLRPAPKECHSALPSVATAGSGDDRFGTGHIALADHATVRRFAAPTTRRSILAVHLAKAGLGCRHGAFAQTPPRA